MHLPWNDQRICGGINSRDVTPIADQFHSPFRQKPERERVYAMLNFEDTGSEGFGGIIVTHRHSSLCDNRSGVCVRSDEMNGRA